MAPNTFYNFYHGINPLGTFTFLSILGNLQYEIGNKEGNITLIKTYKKKSNGNNGGLTTDSCTEWYYVTTTTYPDGHTEEDWEYLYTTCNGCEPWEDCNENGSGGGGGSSGGGGEGNNQSTTEFVSISDEETQYTGEDLDEGGGYSRITYTYRASIQKIDGEIIYITVHPVSASPTVGYYIDSYGRSVTRTITLYSQMNSYSLLSATSALVNWSCAVIGVYQYSNGNPTWTNQWYKSKSKVYN